MKKLIKIQLLTFIFFFFGMGTHFAGEKVFVGNHILSIESLWEYRGEKYSLRKSQYALDPLSKSPHSHRQIAYYYLCRESDRSSDVLAVFTRPGLSWVKGFGGKNFIAIISSDGFFGSITTYSTCTFSQACLDELSKTSIPWNNKYFTPEVACPKALQELMRNHWIKSELPYCGDNDDSVRRQGWRFESFGGEILAYPIAPRIKKLSGIMCYVYDARKEKWNPRPKTETSALAAQNAGKRIEGKDLSLKEYEVAVKMEKRARWQEVVLVTGVVLFCGFSLWRKLLSRKK